MPGTEHIPLATMKKLLAMADGGKPVLFLDALLSDVPGFKDFEIRRNELKSLLKNRASLVATKEELRKRLASAGAVREPLVDEGLDFIRRTYDNGYHYFIANMGDKPVDGWVALGKRFQSAVIMDPLTAETGRAVSRGNGNELYLQLLPGEALIIRTLTNLYR